MYIKCFWVFCDPLKQDFSLETCTGQIFQSRKIQSRARPLPRKYILSGPAREIHVLFCSCLQKPA